MSPRELGKLVERVDLNGDGAINFDEFAASLVDWQQVGMHPELLLPPQTGANRVSGAPCTVQPPCARRRSPAVQMSTHLMGSAWHP